MEDAFGHDFSGVRLHDNRASDALNRELAATAFTVGSDIYFRQGRSSTLSPQGSHLLAHELAHVTQQHGPAAVHTRIHRHASWEHKMLGDIDPADLEVIASGRDMAKQGVGKGAKKTLTLPGGRKFTGEDVLHTIDQEIARLQYFGKNPPIEATEDAADQLVTDFAADQGLVAGPRAQKLAAEWKVRLVSIPLKDKSKAVLSYGEVNTLPDFFGNVEEIKQTDPKMFRNYLDGIREESILKFMRLRNEVAGGLGQQNKYNPDDAAHKVGQSMGNTGTTAPGVLGVAGGDAYGELKMMGAVKDKWIMRRLAPTSGRSEKKAQLAGKEETSYTAGLGRNACHFAPYSWHAWGDAHRKSEDIALKAWKLRDSVALLKRLDQVSGKKPTKAEQKKRDTDLATADDLQNEALVQNAFADHFLQDSFAAGHLINKTLIMQWFTKWLDEHKAKRDYTSQEKWRQVQNIAYGQAGVAGMGLYRAKVGTTASNDPQTVENIEKVGSGQAERAATWEDRYKALGLAVPRALTKIPPTNTRCSPGGS